MRRIVHPGIMVGMDPGALRGGVSERKEQRHALIVTPCKEEGRLERKEGESVPAVRLERRPEDLANSRWGNSEKRKMSVGGWWKRWDAPGN